MKHPLSHLNLLTLSAFVMATAHAADPSFEIFSYTGKDLFPSAIISTATVDWSAFSEIGAEEADEEDQQFPVLGDPNAWLGVMLFDVPEEAKIKVEMSGEGWMKPSTFVGKAVTREGDPIQGDLDVLPKGVWDYDVLRKVREQKSVSLTVKVTIDGVELPEQTETFIMRSMNDCPFFIIDDEEDEEDEESGDVKDISWCFAAYVNENHPWIDGLLKEALASAKDAEGKPLIGSFSGYQSGSSEEVLKQVFAIWQVLQRRGIQYSAVSTTVPSKTVVSQVVRFVDESIDAKQANSVDGSVLMASILTKIGLHAYLVMIPGHCYLAFDEGAGGETLIGLETTLLGQEKLKSIEDLKALQPKEGDKKLDMKKLNGMVSKEAEVSMKTFLNAIDSGNANLDKFAEAFADASDPSIQIISITQWRKLGIMPLASGKEKQ